MPRHWSKEVQSKRGTELGATELGAEPSWPQHLHTSLRRKGSRGSAQQHSHEAGLQTFFKMYIKPKAIKITVNCLMDNKEQIKHITQKLA